jgi:hypothetical protein
MSKQTAVEWLKNQIECFGNKHELQMSWATLDELLEQAKEMHKQEIIDACLSNKTNHPVIKEIFEIQAEQYYKENYGK